MANKNPVGKWKPGITSPNPGGKPVNARNQITKKFLEVLAKDFEAKGEAALQAARKTDPMGYIRAVASLLPKEFVIERPMDGMSDDELAATLGILRERLASLEAARDGILSAAEREQASDVSTLQ